MEPFLLHRVTKEVEKSLPAQNEQIQRIEMPNYRNSSINESSEPTIKVKKKACSEMGFWDLVILGVCFIYKLEVLH